MKTKPIPAIIMLIAGFVTCIMSIYNHLDLGTFTKTLLLVLIIFYLFGIVIKIVLDKNFPVMSEEESEEEESPEGESETEAEEGNTAEQPETQDEEETATEEENI